MLSGVIYHNINKRMRNQVPRWRIKTCWEAP